MARGAEVGEGTERGEVVGAAMGKGAGGWVGMVERVVAGKAH
jgi:hypothetical protein